MSLKPEGIAGQIAALKKGASLSMTTRFPSSVTTLAAKARVARADLKNKIAPHVARAKEAGGGEFKTETSVTLSHDYESVLVSVAVTRI